MKKFLGSEQFEKNNFYLYIKQKKIRKIYKKISSRVLNLFLTN